MIRISRDTLFLFVLFSLVGCSTSSNVVTNKRIQKRKLNSGFFVNFGQRQIIETGSIQLEEYKTLDLLVHEYDNLEDIGELPHDTASYSLGQIELEKTSVIKTTSRERLKTSQFSHLKTIGKPVLEFQKRAKHKFLRKMKPKQTNDEYAWALVMAILGVLFGIGAFLALNASNNALYVVFLTLSVALISLALMSVLLAMFMDLFF